MQTGTSNPNHLEHATLNKLPHTSLHQNYLVYTHYKYLQRKTLTSQILPIKTNNIAILVETQTSGIWGQELQVFL